MSDNHAPLSEQCITALGRKKRENEQTWKDVAESLGISVNTVYRLLNKTRGPGLRVALKIARFLGVDVSTVSSCDNS